MSADLLRRAAAALRQHAEQATPGPWSAWPQSSDGQNFVGTGCSSRPAVDIEVDSHDGDYKTDLKRQQVDAELIALMGPPVALALAELLDAHAESVEAEHGYWSTNEAEQAIETARAVLLRESEAVTR